MVSVHRTPLQRFSKKMSLAATDEFWNGVSQEDDAAASSDSDSSMELSLPPAHHQLLATEHQPSFENLKGYDHNQGVVSYDNLDGYETADSESEASFCRQKLSAVKQQGGGSWLLGFARLAETATSNAVSPDQPADMNPPGLRRVSSSGSLDSSDESSSDDDSAASVTAAPTKPKRSRGVNFAESVKVQAIPHSSTLSPFQRSKMYSTCWEVRQNKIRNKKEYRYDGYDWRNSTEEWEMGVDMVTGELIHPAHA